ncbi:MFS transporter [Desulfuromonas sp. AOP6]|uniref:MFS transporter n=1 Tax=Desulfuromonas sp. AOP6 TaxID=1566351 RepID=UPI00128927B5|nr:MFS transporter [Desulfuromonas sp. AOP6]BCA79409.1 MFS transporter [Desulfuromonas sp. AOP6]
MLYTTTFLMMFVANLTTVSSFTAFFLFPLFIGEHGGSQGDIGIIMGTFALASALCRPWISEMVDRMGRKKSYTCGCFILVLMPLTYLTFSGSLNDFYWPLLVVRVIHGIGIAICFTAVFTYMADIIPRDRLNEGLGMFGTSGLIGLAVGPALGEWVLRHGEFAHFFVMSSALALVGLLVQWPLRETPADPSHGKAPSFFTLFRRQKHVIVAGLALIFGIGQAASGNFVAPLAEARDLSPISLFYLTYASSAIMIRFLGGKLADRLGEIRLLPWALAITAIGLFTLALVQKNFGLAMAGLLCGVGHGMLFPTLNSMAIRHESYQNRGKITGIFTGSIDLGLFSGSFLLGYIGEIAGPSLLFLAAGGALLLGLLGFHWLGAKSFSAPSA